MNTLMFATNHKQEDEKPSFFTPVNNYRVGHATITWGCICPECGALHEFTRGRGWKFCPMCGCSTERK